MSQCLFLMPYMQPCVCSETYILANLRWRAIGGMFVSIRIHPFGLREEG